MHWCGPTAAEEVRRARDLAERKKAKEERRKARAAAAEAGASAAAAPAAASGAAAAAKPPVPATPIAFLFPGQGSQAVGMLKVGKDCWKVWGEDGPRHGMLHGNSQLCLLVQPSLRFDPQQSRSHNYGFSCSVRLFPGCFLRCVLRPKPGANDLCFPATWLPCRSLPSCLPSRRCWRRQRRCWAMTCCRCDSSFKIPDGGTGGRARERPALERWRWLLCRVGWCRY